MKKAEADTASASCFQLSGNTINLPDEGSGRDVRHIR